MHCPCRLCTLGKSALLPGVCRQNALALHEATPTLQQVWGDPPPTPQLLPVCHNMSSAAKATFLAPPLAQLWLPPGPRLDLGLWEPFPPCHSTCSLSPGIATPAVLSLVHPCLLDQWFGTWQQTESHGELLEVLQPTQVAPSRIRVFQDAMQMTPMCSQA